MIHSTPGAIVIDVRVIPRSSRSGIDGTREGALLVRLHAPPLEGAANTELIELIADALGVPRRAVSIVSGERSRQKRVRVAGISVALARAALEARDGRGGAAAAPRRTS